MLLNGFAHPGITEWEFFAPQQDTTTTRGWQTWLKPPGASWVYVFVISGGGGGGGGQSTAASARAGGGGGASGSFQTLLIPAWALPDLLYVRPGSGGAGGGAAANGTGGTSSIIGIAPSTTTAHDLINIGGGGAGQAAGTAGSQAGTPGLVTFAAFALATVNPGLSGVAGGANTGANGTSSPWANVFGGGAGGAGSGTGNTVFAGGSITSANPTTGLALINTINGGAAGVSGTTPGGTGSPGWNHGVPLKELFSRNSPPVFSGGAGGGSGGASNGGAGGAGAWGCGGGGGGAGAAGGAGGKGGDGFIIIGAF